MKSSTVFFALSVLLLFGGFIFLRNGQSPIQSRVQSSTALNYDLTNYQDYSPATLNASQQRGRTLLFFAATTWCQSCSELEKEISTRASEIPPTLTILKVDYDNDKEMNRRYGVTAQHTLILLDEGGGEASRWLGGDFDTLLREVRKI